AGERGRGEVRARLLRRRQAGRRHLPCALAADRGRRGRGAHPDGLSQHPHRPAQRRRDRGGRGSGRRRRPGHQPQSRRHPRLQRQDGRGIRRGP
ncbi:hypothetical protein LTR94_036589, partial [Friedmanniomyces endolithicus]